MADGVDAALVAAVGQGVRAGSVLEVGEETLVCDVGEGPVECRVLHTSALPPVYHVGDRVLVWSDEAEGTIVVGRVGTLAQAVAADELVIEAGQRLTLKAGDGSITIREDGKVLIKGRDLVSHAKRLNRIKGGSVAIN